MQNRDLVLNELLDPIAVKYSEAELDSYKFIPTVLHRQQIADICCDLSKIINMKYFYLLITTNFSKPLCLGNTPDWSVTYHKHHLERLDIGLNPNEGQSYILTDLIPKDPLVQLFYKWYEAYGIYETYSIIRQSEDIKITAIAHSDKRILDPVSYYESTIDSFEDFTLEFIKKTIDLIKMHRPVLAISPFIIDEKYRNDVIKNRISSSNTALSPREKQILLYIFHGYTSKKIAKTLSLDNRTIEKYISTAKKKLGARNIAHAVKKMIDLKIIDKTDL